MFQSIKKFLKKTIVFDAVKLIENTVTGNRTNRRVAKLEKHFDYKFIVRYNKNNQDLLSRLCDKYGSDKGAVMTSGHPYRGIAHTYADFYTRLFGHYRNNVTKVFECGIGTNNTNLVSNMGVNGQPGASLRVWRDFFPNANIIGADIDKGILFEEDRIKTYYLDQTNPETISKCWEAVGIRDFDLMIDDGLHTFEGGRCLFENSIGQLASHGIYIIEDVHLPEMKMFETYFKDKNYVVDFVNLYRPNVLLSDNNLIVIRHIQV